MTTIHQEIVAKPEQEAQEVDGSSQESSCETTKELFRREPTPARDELPLPEPPRIPTPTTKSTKPTTKSSPPAKKDAAAAAKKKSNSGIPLRLKSGSNAPKSPKGTGTYRHPSGQTLGPVINKNTLEVQFMNNKKRLLQLHSELVDKQRPLLEMHKSLLRTKKQLEELGKKVVLEELKIVSLKTDDLRNQLDGAGENPAAETAMNLKNSIEKALEACVKVCKKCIVKRDIVVRMLESASKSAMEPSEIEAEVEDLKKEKEELEQSVETIMNENEKKIEDLINNWQKSMKMRNLSEEVTLKITDLEDTIKQQQKTIQDCEDNIHNLTRKLDEKKSTYEKTISELQEKTTKLEEDLKKEKKVGNENLMKSRTMRSKVTDLETKAKEAEEKSTDMSNKLKQLQEQMRRKEVQWMKEKDDFKKNEALLQQKFTEKQSQFDTRVKEMEKLQKTSEVQQQNFYRNIETQLEIKDQEFVLMEKEKEALAEKSKVLEEQLEETKRLLEAKEREVEEISTRAAESIPAIEYKPSDSHWMEMMEYKQKMSDVQTTIQQQTDQINKMQSSLKAHAKLAAALKLEKDNALKYSHKLRDILQEARDEIQFKNKTIYKTHEKLVLKDKAYEKLKAQLKEYEQRADLCGDKWNRNRCQICMSTLGADKPEEASCADTEVGKSSVSGPQYVSESLIGMSVKKVDHLRARLDNLKKMKLPLGGKNQVNVKCSWSSCETKPISGKLRKQIELRGKLYQILQKHADQSCEDFINLLKLTVSNGGKTAQPGHELKPSNNDEATNGPRKLASFTESFNATSQFYGAVPITDIYDRLNQSGNSDTDDGTF